MFSMFKTVWGFKALYLFGVRGRGESIFLLVSERKTARSSAESLYLRELTSMHVISTLPQARKRTRAPWNFTAKGTYRAAAPLLSGKES